MSIYYPMDREEYDKVMYEQPERNTKWIRYGHKGRLGITKATGGENDQVHRLPFLFKYTEGITINTC